MCSHPYRLDHDNQPQSIDYEELQHVSCDDTDSTKPAFGLLITCAFRFPAGVEETQALGPQHAISMPVDGGSGHNRKQEKFIRSTQLR